VPVALHFGAERPHHLRVAVVAALADVDVAPGELQRRVGLEARYRLGHRLLEVERDDLDQAADRDDQDDQNDQQRLVALDHVMRNHGSPSRIVPGCRPTQSSSKTARGEMAG